MAIINDLRSNASRSGAAPAAPRNAASRRLRSSKKAESMEITVMRVAGDWNKSIRNCGEKVQEWCEAGLAGAKGFLSVVLADDAFVRDLNHQYRGKNKPTNVLSFPSEGEELGDIVLAYETIKREAAEQKKSFPDHVAHLIVHGVLHLRGFDHEEDAMAEKMEKKEIAILAKLGITNPYEST